MNDGLIRRCTQVRDNAEDGDCLAACLSSITGLSPTLFDILPSGDTQCIPPETLQRLAGILQGAGFAYCSLPLGPGFCPWFSQPETCILIYRFPEFTHAVVGQVHSEKGNTFFEVVHDPSPSLTEFGYGGHLPVHALLVYRTRRKHEDR